MKKTFAVLGIALAATSFAVPSYSADSKADEKTAQELAKQGKPLAQKANKEAKALAKLKKQETKAAKKAAREAAKLAKKHVKNPAAHAVPEVDGSHAALAISLLAGAVAIARERRRHLV